MNSAGSDECSMPRVLLIDDESFVHDLVCEALTGCCCVISVETGEDALMATTQWLPDLILVDVEMPGMGGYETCRRFKGQEETAQLPVLFLSGHDLLEERLMGYEAGGDDYMTKPFELDELKAKVLHLLALNKNRSELKSMADFASSAAMTAMSSMSEMGALLEVLKRFNGCDSWSGLASIALEGLAAFDLHGVVQLRLPSGKLTLTSQGAASPLEESVIEHLQSMERIVHFKSRLCISYELVSLLVNDMPVEDEGRCGRLRDHLAMLVEGADARVKSILVTQESRLRGAAIERTVMRISEALREIDGNQRSGRSNARMAVEELLQKVDHALLGVALTESQEAFLAGTVREGVEKILAAQASEIDVQNRLTEITQELKNTLPA